MQELRRFVPIGSKPAKRKLFLTKSAMRDLDDDYSATNSLCGRGFIQQALTHWTRGERVWEHNGKGEFLKRLDPPPPEIWEIRVTAPRPQARLFGRFAEADSLIVTKFHTRDFLKDKDSANWETAINQCKNQWERLFPDFPPFVGTKIGEYVTENCDDYKI